MKKKKLRIISKNYGKKRKKYLETSIYDEVEKKIYTIDIVRAGRIIKSQRLYSYAEKWKQIFFWMNIEAVIFLIVSLVQLKNNDSVISLIVSGVFSVYTIVLQYYVDSLNYNERALRLHYHQLQLEQFILELKGMIFGWQKTETMEIETYLNIMRKYQIELGGYENHDEIDREKAQEKGNKYLKPGRRKKISIFIRENLFMKTQVVFMIFFLIGYIVAPILYR